jgi:hypothetical protein
LDFVRLRGHFCCKKSGCLQVTPQMMCVQNTRSETCVGSVCRNGLPQLNLRKLLTVPRIRATNTRECIELMMCELSEHVRKNKKSSTSVLLSFHYTGHKACAHYTHSFHFSVFLLSHSVLLIYTEESSSVLFYLLPHKKWIKRVSVAVFRKCLALISAGTLAILIGVIGTSKNSTSKRQFSKYIQILKDTHHMFWHVLCRIQV